MSCRRGGASRQCGPRQSLGPRMILLESAGVSSHDSQRPHTDPVNLNGGIVMKLWRTIGVAVALGVLAAGTERGRAGDKKDNTPPPGFTALFNGKDLTNWQ